MYYLHFLSSCLFGLCCGTSILLPVQRVLVIPSSPFPVPLGACVENWALGNCVAAFQLLVSFAEVVHDNFLLCSCVFIFVCFVQISSVFSVVSVYGLSPGFALHTW